MDILAPLVAAVVASNNPQNFDAFLDCTANMAVKHIEATGGVADVGAYRMNLTDSEEGWGFTQSKYDSAIHTANPAARLIPATADNTLAFAIRRCTT